VRLTSRRYAYRGKVWRRRPVTWCETKKSCETLFDRLRNGEIDRGVLHVATKGKQKKPCKKYRHSIAEHSSADNGVRDLPTIRPVIAASRLLIAPSRVRENVIVQRKAGGTMDQDLHQRRAESTTPVAKWALARTVRRRTLAGEHSKRTLKYTKSCLSTFFKRTRDVGGLPFPHLTFSTKMSELFLFPCAF